MLLARRAADSISGVVVRGEVWGLAEAGGYHEGWLSDLPHPPLSDLSQSEAVSGNCVSAPERRR